jgi:tRNA-modifying protein YgfZ
MLNVIQIEGEDAKSFLQGLVTADMEKLPSPAALLTPQGKIIADFYIHADLTIDIRKELVDTLIKRLSLYKLRAKVSWAIIGEKADIPLAERLDDLLPQFGLDYSDSFPHEANMDLNGAVSFTKGCYVGQEIVSRMQHRSTTRRRVVRYECETEIAPFTDVLIDDVVIGKTGRWLNGIGFMQIRTDKLEGEITANHLMIKPLF